MTNPIKIMFDSNAFDYIHNENLLSDLLNSVKKGKVECIRTDIQKQEIGIHAPSHIVRPYTIHLVRRGIGRFLPLHMGLQSRYKLVVDDY
jgi:hypothetical protein